MATHYNVHHFWSYSLGDLDSVKWITVDVTTSLEIKSKANIFTERNFAKQKLQENLQLSFEQAQSWSKVVPHLSQSFLKHCIAANSCDNNVSNWKQYFDLKNNKLLTSAGVCIAVKRLKLTSKLLWKVLGNPVNKCPHFQSRLLYCHPKPLN